MSPDVSAQIIAKAWLDASFAQALQGSNPYAAIHEALGVSVPPGTPLPPIPPAPADRMVGLGVQWHRRGIQCGFCSECVTLCPCGSTQPCRDTLISAGASGADSAHTDV